jgi:hypothetical protein
MEIMSVFFYHLYRKLSREEYKRILSVMEEESKGAEEEERNTKEQAPQSYGGHEKRHVQESIQGLKSSYRKTILSKTE